MVAGQHPPGVFWEDVVAVQHPPGLFWVDVVAVQHPPGLFWEDVGEEHPFHSDVVVVEVLEEGCLQIQVDC